MAREPQWKVLKEMLQKAPGNALTLREIHLEGYIQNVADAAMQARRHGINITTEYLHDNPKIASYVLHQGKEEEIGDVVYPVTNAEGELVGTQKQLFPTNQRHYE